MRRRSKVDNGKRQGHRNRQVLDCVEKESVKRFCQGQLVKISGFVGHVQTTAFLYHSRKAGHGMHVS